nr:hypothetical protein DM860_001884 [Ipomoea batatas]
MMFLRSGLKTSLIVDDGYEINMQISNEMISLDGLLDALVDLCRIKNTINSLKNGL